MNEIALPKKINFEKSKDANHAIVTVEPCYPGYGITLGNSIRRVLLSSLPGAAVIGVKIDGVDHEFMTLPHVKEDILEIILNLKELRIKIFSDDEEEIKLELAVHGKKEVKASDIKKNSNIEIVNGDLTIANITDMAGSLKMEIYVSKGRGYRSVEAIEEKKNEIGYIDMDSIFTPVISTGVKVENVRVGKMTNWDKLVLDIVTDGTIAPEEAFEQAVNILIKQFSALIGEGIEDDSADSAEVSEDKIEEEKGEENIKEEALADEPVEEKKKPGRPKKEDN